MRHCYQSDISRVSLLCAMAIELNELFYAMRCVVSPIQARQLTRIACQWPIDRKFPVVLVPVRYNSYYDIFYRDDYRDNYNYNFAYIDISNRVKLYSYYYIYS